MCDTSSDQTKSTKEISEDIISSECETIETNNHDKFIRSYKIDPVLKEKLMEIPEALDYIEKLERIIEKQIKKILKWKKKFKQRKFKDVSTQTSCEEDINILKDENETVTPDVAKSIADDIKEAAETAMQNSGFVFEETSGMYYDYNTGYYYNAEYGLYYDGHTGTYLKYNQETQNYDFHSQVAAAAQPNVTNSQDVRTHKKPKRKKAKEDKPKEWKRPKRDENSPEKDIEEGEICSLSSDSSESDVDMISDSSDISRSWPPCMRVIVESSENPKIKVGSLHIITCDGGTLGREGNHSILLPDLNVSKHHLKFVFDKETNKYLVTDLGSRNGTTLNGKRMSPSKQESEALEVMHGTKIHIGTNVLLCHIHDGSQTCGHCEPGLVQSKTEVPDKIDKISMSDKHKNELKKLKKQCGFVGSNDNNTKLASGYTDRAQKRRETIGSQNPHEKTKMASVNESISAENKGFKLLSKMGWKEGQSLGKTGEGVVEPINVIGNSGKTGVGAENVIPPSVPVNENKQNIWKKAQERFEKLPSHPTFAVSDDEN